MNYSNTLGGRIKKQRKALGYSQIEFAEILNISPNYLSTIETGKAYPPYRLYEQLYTHLNVDPNYLSLGTTSSNNVPAPLTDKLKNLPEEKIQLVSAFIDMLLDYDL